MLSGGRSATSVSGSKVTGDGQGAAAQGAPWLRFREAAEKLQTDAFVFDYVPLGEPCIPTPRHLAVMRDSLSAGRGLEETQRAMLDDRLRELAEDPACAAAVRESWVRSGVDAALVTLGGREIEPTQWDAILRDLAYWQAREHAGNIAICRTASDLTEQDRIGKIIFGLQDAAALADDPARLDILFKAGLRVVQLTYNSRNAFADGCKEANDTGLSPRGIELIRRMNDLGIVVDVSHCSHRTTLDAIRVSRIPVAVTHSFCHALFEHPRGKTDEVLRALKDTGGYFGLAVIPSFFVKDGVASLDHLARHLDHACNILGPEQVGIGTDYGWVTPDIPRELVQAGLDKFVQLGFAPQDLKYHGEGVDGFRDWVDWPNIPALLLSMGFPKDDVKNIIGGNWLRLFALVESAAVTLGDQSSAASALRDRLTAGERQLWLNPALRPAQEALSDLRLQWRDIQKADADLLAWAPSLAQLFPELRPAGGLIESELHELSAVRDVLGESVDGRVFLKRDDNLPVAGSIKARGGIYEVLAHAQALLDASGQNVALASDAARALFSDHTISVGSTGNLGLSIGVMAAALGFRAVVHMSRDAKAWKKTRLRQRGVTVIEHAGDYASAVEAGRRAAETDPSIYFVDDENSERLFIGYAVAALRLRDQLAAAKVVVDRTHPLAVYLPCGVGGAPGGITFGLKHMFGDAVHCFFAEPCAAPAVLIGLAYPGQGLSAYDFGLDGRTAADGLAVVKASDLVCEMMHHLVSGVFTVSDSELHRFVYRLHQQTGIPIEPSAAAGFPGPARLQQAGLHDLGGATHVIWTTGGAFVPPDEFAAFLARGRKADSESD